MIAIVGIHYRNYTQYGLHRSCLPIYGIAIISSLSFLFLDDFEGNANISVAIKSGSTVFSQVQKENMTVKVKEIRRRQLPHTQSCDLIILRSQLLQTQDS